MVRDLNEKFSHNETHLKNRCKVTQTTEDACQRLNKCSTSIYRHVCALRSSFMTVCIRAKWFTRMFLNTKWHLFSLLQKHSLFAAKIFDTEWYTIARSFCRQHSTNIEGTRVWENLVSVQGYILHTSNAY